MLKWREFFDIYTCRFFRFFDKTDGIFSNFFQHYCCSAIKDTTSFLYWFLVLWCFKFGILKHFLMFLGFGWKFRLTMIFAITGLWSDSVVVETDVIWFVRGFFLVCSFLSRCGWHMGLLVIALLLSELVYAWGKCL